MSASLRLLRLRVCPASLCQFHAVILIVELTATGKLPCVLRQDWLRTWPMYSVHIVEAYHKLGLGVLGEKNGV